LIHDKIKEIIESFEQFTDIQTRKLDPTKENLILKYVSFDSNSIFIPIYDKSNKLKKFIPI